MELSPANKAALLLRFSAMFGDDRSYPGWNGLTLAEQLEWQRCDPEAAAIAKGDVSAPHEAWLCTNQLSPEMPGQSDEEVRKGQVAEILAAGNPYGEPGRIEEGRMIPGTQGNFTQQQMLQALDPDEAERQRRLSQGTPKAHQWTDREVQILRRSGYAVPGQV